MAVFKAACVQLNSGSDLAANLRAIEHGVREAAAHGAQLVTLPEYAALLDGSGRVMRENSFAEDAHPALAAGRALARDTGVWLLAGSLTIRIDDSFLAHRSFPCAPAGAGWAASLAALAPRQIGTLAQHLGRYAGDGGMRPAGAGPGPPRPATAALSPSSSPSTKPAGAALTKRSYRSTPVA